MVVDLIVTINRKPNEFDIIVIGLSIAFWILASRDGVKYGPVEVGSY